MPRRRKQGVALNNLLRNAYGALSAVLSGVNGMTINGYVEALTEEPEQFAVFQPDPDPDPGFARLAIEDLERHRRECDEPRCTAAFAA